VSPAKSKTLRIVIDGSNMATEGRTAPSLAQLNEVIVALGEEYPGAEVIVVADASFEHRADASERAKFNEALVAGDIVTPPAGAVGRGDGFILKIADRINGVVLSNDSFQEFHEEYPWLFDVGRLVGGKPVRGVGWVFTPRVPVRATKTSRSADKLKGSLVEGVVPEIGATVTPVKKAAKVAVKKVVKKADAKPVKKAAKKAAKEPVKKVAKKVAKANAAPSTPPPVMRRDRQPVNPEAEFTTFKGAYRVGAKVEGTVTAFTSHGAVVMVQLKRGLQMECYAPTAGLGTPAPARARDVLKRGETKVFRLMSIDTDRRIAELSLP
jgi:hypothetical protein